MKLNLFFLLLLIVTVNSYNYCAQSENYNNIIDSLKIKYAPDKRVALFKIKIQNQNTKIKILGETNQPEALEQLKKILVKDNVSFIDSVRILPDAKQLKNLTYAVVNLPVINCRVGQEHFDENITQALLGMPVRVLKVSDNTEWYYQF